MAGIAEADTEMAYAWALDYDDPDEFPTQRLTPRRITSLAIAASLTVIAVAGAVALTVTHDVNQPVAQAPSSSVVETVPPQHITVTAPPPVTVTVPAAALPTYDPSPADPGWPTDPRFHYGSALPHDSRFSYGVVPGGPCGMATREFGFTTEAIGEGAIVTCNHDTLTWILVSQDRFRFDGTHSRGSRCDGSGAAMSLDGRHMICVTGANSIGAWQEDR
jgi:hypothetical protein